MNILILILLLIVFWWICRSSNEEKFKWKFYTKGDIDFKPAPQPTRTIKGVKEACYPTKLVDGPYWCKVGATTFDKNTCTEECDWPCNKDGKPGFIWTTATGAPQCLPPRQKVV